MEELQSALHKHLGGTTPQKAQPLKNMPLGIILLDHIRTNAEIYQFPVAGPKRYHMFKQAIGSKQTKLGFHGMIALTIFAR